MGFLFSLVLGIIGVFVGLAVMTGERSNSYVDAIRKDPKHTPPVGGGSDECKAAYKAWEDNKNEVWRINETMRTTPDIFFRDGDYVVCVEIECPERMLYRTLDEILSDRDLRDSCKEFYFRKHTEQNVSKDDFAIKDWIYDTKTNGDFVFPGMIVLEDIVDGYYKVCKITNKTVCVVKDSASRAEKGWMDQISGYVTRGVDPGVREVKNGCTGILHTLNHMPSYRFHYSFALSPIDKPDVDFLFQFYNSHGNTWAPLHEEIGKSKNVKISFDDYTELRYDLVPEFARNLEILALDRNTNYYSIHSKQQIGVKVFEALKKQYNNALERGVNFDYPKEFDYTPYNQKYL